MTKSGRRTMGISNRLKRRIQSKGTRGNIIKSLAELIKNADDAYDRLDEYRDITPGTIEVAYDQLKVGKGFSIKGFIVRDFASGMSTQRMEQVYHSKEGDMEGNYGKDTSDETRNGAIGVGGKDCFFELEECFILSVCDGILTVAEIYTDKQGLGSEILTGNDAKQVMDSVNEILTRGELEPITLDKNQTIATFKIPEDWPGLQEKTLVERLRQYYTVRWILEADIRTVNLTDIYNKHTRILQHTPKESEVVYEKSLSIPNKQIPYDVHFELRKSEEDLDHSKEYGYGILIRSKRGAVLDNSMYEFEKDSAAKKIFGEVTITDWKKMYRQDETVLTDNREGLDYAQNQFNKQIKNLILTQLRKEVEKERAKQGDNPELDENLDKNIKKALDMINQIILKDPDAGRQAEDEPESVPTGLQFGSPVYTFPPEQTKKIKLYLDPGSVPTNSEIGLIPSNDSIKITPEDSILTPVSYEEFTSENRVPFVEIEVKGKELDMGKETRTTLKAIYGELEAETEIYIKREQGMYPPNGFAFLPPKTTIRPKKPRKIKLVIDTNLIAVGTPIHLKSSDDRLKFKPTALTVSGPPNLGQYLTEEIITISAEKVGLKVELSAETETKMTQERNQQPIREIRTSVCRIEVKEKEPPKKFFNGYEFDPEGAPNVRSRFDSDRGFVMIHHRSPILRSVFGPNLERVNPPKQELDALTLLSDTVIQRVFSEWARWRVENDKVVTLGDAEVATEIEREKNRLEYKYGLGLFQVIKTGKLQPQN